MCLDLDAVEEVEKIGLPVDEHVCRSKKGECPFAGICGYQRQKEAEADVWIGAHEMLSSEKPKTMGDLAAVIVDEAAWQDGLEGVSDPPNDLALAAIDPNMEVPGDEDGTKTARWRELLRRLLDGLAAHNDGELSAGPLLEAGLDEDTAHEGRRLAWDCVVDPGIVPGMSAEAAPRTGAHGGGKQNGHTHRGCLRQVCGAVGRPPAGRQRMAGAAAQRHRRGAHPRAPHPRAAAGAQGLAGAHPTDRRPAGRAVGQGVLAQRPSGGAPACEDAAHPLPPDHRPGFPAKRAGAGPAPGARRRTSDGCGSRASCARPCSARRGRPTAAC